jgi:hypothetical protein
MPDRTRCPACKAKRRYPNQYLCPDCWFTLPDSTQRALKRRDRRAGARLIELHHQLADNVPLCEIRIEVDHHG